MNHKKRLYTIATIVFILDQLIKIILTKTISEKGIIKIIPNFFSLYYIKNTGAAFSILENKQVLLIAISAIIIVIIHRIVEKENLNLMNVFPFGCFENEIISEDLEYSVESVENSLNYDDYLEYISNNSLIYAKLYKIINKIISQISIRNPDLRIFGANNIFNSYENMSSFVNYPFILKNNLSITSLSDAGFYCENAFTNELKLCNYPKSRLTDTDMLTSKENIELYLKENIPSYIYNSPLRDYSPIINSSYVINNMNFIEEEEKIELYDINPKYPLIATCTKNGIVNIYSYSLGLHKLGSVNIFKGIKKPKNFSEIGDVFSDCEKTGSFNGIQNVKNIEEFLMNKKTLLDVNNKGIHVKFNLNNKKEQEIKVNEEALKQLVQMGFGKEACIKALKEKKNNLQEAIDLRIHKIMNQKLKKKLHKLKNLLESGLVPCVRMIMMVPKNARCVKRKYL